MKKQLFLSLAVALFACSVSAFSPPGECNQKKSEVCEFSAPSDHFETSNVYTINATSYDVIVDVAVIDSPALPVATVSNYVNNHVVTFGKGIGKSYSYWFKPPLLHVNKYCFQFNRATAFASAYTIRLLNLNKRC